MRKIILVEFLTLDGVMQAPGGDKEDTSGGFEYGGWVGPYFDEEAGQIMGEQMNRPFALLLGRKTFEIFGSYWPEHDKDWPSINGAKKYFVSKHSSKISWQNSEQIKGDVVEEIKKLKQTEGPDFQVYGSSVLVQTLLKNDLVDEMWLKIFPITLGTGKHLFGDGVLPKRFKLTSSQITSKGVIAANYVRIGEVETKSIEP